MSIKNVISSDRHILPNGYNHHHHHENNDESGSKDSIIEEKKLQQSDNGVEQQRDQWGGQVEFLLACLGNAVGLGNVCKLFSGFFSVLYDNFSLLY